MAGSLAALPFAPKRRVFRMNSKIARAHFYGNLKLIGDRETNPEKYNLYFGLAKLAEAVSDVDRRIQLLRQEVALLQPHVEKSEQDT